MNDFAPKGINGFKKGHIVPKNIRDKIKESMKERKGNSTSFIKGHKTNLGKIFDAENYPDYAMRNKNHKEETKTNIRLSNIGKHLNENNHFWKGGITPINRRLRESSAYKIWRELVFLRDNFTCQNTNCPFCGNKIGGEIHPHHIKKFSDFPILRFDISNGITLCVDFHRSITWKEEQYENILMEMLK